MSNGSSSKTVRWIVMAIIVAGLIVGGAILFGDSGDDNAGDKPAATPTVTVTAQASGTPTATPTPTSTTGAVVDTAMSTDDVMQLQKGLAAAGLYKGPIDGVYGPETEAAVKAAQEKLGVTPDGIWGPETSKAYQAYLKEQSGKKQPDYFVMQMQADLSALKYYTGKVDGFYGPETEAAVKAFQKDDGLPVTGKLDSKTVAEINKAMKEK